jgi:hypothetical protein
MGSLEEEGAAAIRLSWARSKKKAMLLLLLACGRSGQNLGGTPRTLPAAGEELSSLPPQLLRSLPI